MPANLLPYLLVIIAYFLIFVAIPFWLRGFRFRDENTGDKMVSTFLFSHLAVIFSVYFLSLLGIYHRFTLIISLVLTCFGYRYLANPGRRGAFVARFIYHMKNLTDSVELPQVMLMNWLGSLKAGLILIIKKINNPFAFLVTVGIFGYRIYITSYHSLFNSFFGTSDMYVHTQWIKHLKVNEPFHSGVYPMGFHAVALALADVFGFNIITVMQMLGAIIGFMLLFSLYYLLKKTMRSSFAVNIVLALFVLPELFPNWATERHFLALPQEYGGIFLYFAAFYLWSFLKEIKRLSQQTGLKADALFFESYDLVDIDGLKKKRAWYKMPYGSPQWFLVHLALTISLTILIHPFITVFTGLLCTLIFLTHLRYISWKVLNRLVIAVVIAFSVAVLPLAVGLLKGISLNSSFLWAASIVTETSVEIHYGPPEPALAGVPMEVETEMEMETYHDIFDYIAKNMKATGQFTKYNDLDAFWFVPMLIIALLGIVVGFIPWRERGRNEIYAAFSLYSITLVILYILSFLRIFALMEFSRLFAYFIYSLPLSLAVLPELFYIFMLGERMNDESFIGIRRQRGKQKLAGKIRRVIYLCSLLVISVAGSLVIYANYGMQRLQRVSLMQYNGAIKAYYQIRNEFPRNQWMIISSFAEYTQVLFDGYHYNISDFILDLEFGNPDEPLEMEAENVFLYIIKKPNRYNYITSLARLGEDPGLPYYDPAGADVDLRVEAWDHNSYSIYSDLRLSGVLQAKAEAWAGEFMKNFPKEISVYYDDEDIMVYRIKQNVYDLNDFRIGAWEE